MSEVQYMNVRRLLTKTFSEGKGDGLFLIIYVKRGFFVNREDFRDVSAVCRHQLAILFFRLNYAKVAETEYKTITTTS